jgi:hypothetical protein
MGGYAGKATNHPRNVIGGQARAEVEGQWGEMTGTVVSFDPANQTARVQPDYQRRLNGEPTPLPELQDVPVRMPRQGGFVITTPVKAGDKVTLRPQSRNSEAFHGGGDYVAPDARSASLSDMEAFLDGGEPLSNPIPNFNNTNMELRSEDGQFAIEMSEDGKFRLRGAMGDAFDLMAVMAEKLAADTLVIKYGSSAGSGHQLQFKSDYADIASKLRGMSLA